MIREITTTLTAVLLFSRFIVRRFYRSVVLLFFEAFYGWFLLLITYEKLKFCI